jgi:lactaldehyde dehydrogenase
VLINGEFYNTKEKINVYNPYTLELIGSVANCNIKDVKKAVDAAKNARNKIKNLTPYERYDLLFSIYEKIKKNRKTLSELITKENGKTIRESREEIDRSLQTILFSAEESKRINGERLSSDVTPIKTKKQAFTILEPIGVVAAICPYNYPLNLMVHKVAPAIAAGNTVVVKPASHTPLTAYEFGKICTDVGLPPGILNIISGPGNIVGTALIQSNVNMISFTGSISVGQEISKNIRMKKMSLELGGNSPLIIMDDADLENVLRVAVEGSFGTAGQRCTSVKRILLHEKIADDFIYKFTDATERLIVGDPMNEKTDIGPVIDENTAIEIEKRVNDSLSKGAKLLTGGKRKKTLYWPTILDNIPRDTKLICTETFGPVAPIIHFNTLEEAVEIANETQYGLQAGFFSDSLKNIKYAMKNIETGALVINGPPGFRIDSLPFGGVKNSGLGREGVKYAIREMTEIKTVIF